MNYSEQFNYNRYSDWINKTNIWKIIYGILSQLIYNTFNFLTIILDGIITKLLPASISTINILLVHLLFFLFIGTLGYLIIFQKLPNYGELFNSLLGKTSDKKDYERPFELNNEEYYFEYIMNYIGRSINMFFSNIFNLFPTYELSSYIEREKTDEGRCDDIENLSNNNFCVSNKNISNIIWDFKNYGEGSDYGKLPPTLRDDSKLKIKIPLEKDDFGLYYPKCDQSFYYNDNGDNILTDLFENDENDKFACKYKVINPSIISSTVRYKNNDGIIGSYA